MQQPEDGEQPPVLSRQRAHPVVCLLDPQHVDDRVHSSSGGFAPRRAWCHLDGWMVPNAFYFARVVIGDDVQRLADTCEPYRSHHRCAAPPIGGQTEVLSILDGRHGSCPDVLPDRTWYIRGCLGDGG